MSLAKMQSPLRRNESSYSEAPASDATDPMKGAEYIRYTGQNVLLISPTNSKQIIQIKNPTLRLTTSRDSLRELIEIEEQINDMSVLPDFGYHEDNYILPSATQYANKWKALSMLLHDKGKFG